MRRRAFLLAAAAAVTSGCRELRRYHSRVKFSPPKGPIAAGQPFEVTIDYLDEGPGLNHELVLLSPQRTPVSTAPVPDGVRRITLQAVEPGLHALEFRENNRMIAHLNVEVR